MNVLLLIIDVKYVLIFLNRYYLQTSGAMAKNTKVEEYKLGANGAWIK